jgi:hypothetical protein
MQTREARSSAVDAAVCRVRIEVATARLVGELSVTERCALNGLIGTLARLLGEPLPE